MPKPVTLGRRAAIGVSAIAMAFAAAGSAAALTPRLEPPAAGDYRQPEEPFVIRLSEPYPRDAGRLALELDNVDVTSRVQPADDTYTVFVYRPYTPLARGPHVLRLVEYADDGRIVERGRWTVRVRLVETRVSPTLNYGASHRIDEKPESGEPGRSQGQGSSRVEAYTDNGRRRYAANGDFLIDSNTGAATGADRRTVEIGDFLFSRDSAHTNVSAGHHFPGAIQGVAQGNLIFDGYQRRGLSATAHAGPWQSALTGFALRTESIRGFERGLGIGDDDNRLSGGMARVQPFANVAVAMGYVSGEGADAGFGTGASDAGLEGDAGNVVVDTVWFDRRLRLGTEAAYSNLDLGPGFGEVSDQAYAVSLAFAPHRGLALGDRLLRWDVTLGYVDLGAGFRSIGNLGQVANIREYRSGLNAYLGDVSLNLSGSRTEDNVDSDLYPSTRTETLNTVLGWQPGVAEDFGGWLFRQPYLSLTLQGDRRETVRQPPGSAAFEVDLTTRGYIANASFGHPFGRWALSGGTTLTDDDTDLTPDMRYDTAGLEIGLQFGARYSLAPGISYDTATDRDNQVSVRTTSLRLSQYLAILADTLDLQIGASLNRSGASDDTQETEQWTGDMRLSWYHGPVTLWLAGNYFEVDSRMVASFAGPPVVFEQDRDTYQVLMGISLNVTGVSFP